MDLKPLSTSSSTTTRYFYAAAAAAATATTTISDIIAMIVVKNFIGNLRSYCMISEIIIEVAHLHFKV